MTRLPVLGAVVAVAAVAAAAYALASFAPADADTADGPVLAASTEPEAAHVVAWEGYAKLGVADRFAHTRETEPLVAPFARMGFGVEVPEGTGSLMFRLAWPEGPEMHLMAHGPAPEECATSTEPASGGCPLPTYMGGHDTSGAMCFAIPAEDVVPGVWKVMAHVDKHAKDVAFTIETVTSGPAPATVLDGYHGHKMTGKTPMEEREIADC